MCEIGVDSAETRANRITQACGLVFAKMQTSEPAVMDDVLRQLEAIGKARYRVAIVSL